MSTDLKTPNTLTCQSLPSGSSSLDQTTYHIATTHAIGLIEAHLMIGARQVAIAMLDANGCEISIPSSASASRQILQPAAEPFLA